MTASQPMQGNSTSTVLGRRLGGELTRLRAAAGMTQPHAAKALTASTTKIAKMERGWVPMRDPDIRALCELYGVRDPGTIGGLLELAKVDRERRKAKGWWDDYTTLGDMHEYVTLESVATSIKAWQPAFIPGLLQTPEYMRSLRSDAPGIELTEADEEFISARMRRQHRLTEEPLLTLRTVIYEAALRNLVGGAETMRGQLKHLSTEASRPNVTIHVLPFASGARLGLNCPFNIVSFAEPGAMDLVYTEVAFTRLWTEGGEGAARHDELFERIAQHALSESDSLTFIRSLSKEL
ncbi:helix-turn-helix domain-containing protein [Streptomyces sp. NPDC052236]|uniref:helix-turn-helix domain-containing protein n=1 Tax=Streptomyces sp. NPDC052236 TaxID=3365686 RepID=UPI0037D3B1A3